MVVGGVVAGSAGYAAADNKTATLTHGNPCLMRKHAAPGLPGLGDVGKSTRYELAHLMLPCLGRGSLICIWF